MELARVLVPSWWGLGLGRVGDQCGWREAVAVGDRKRLWCGGDEKDWGGTVVRVVWRGSGRTRRVHVSTGYPR